MLPSPATSSAPRRGSMRAAAALTMMYNAAKPDSAPPVTFTTDVTTMRSKTNCPYRKATVGRLRCTSVQMAEGTVTIIVSAKVSDATRVFSSSVCIHRRMAAT